MPPCAGTTAFIHYTTMTKSHKMASRQQNCTYLVFLIVYVYACIPNILCMQMCKHMCEHGCGNQRATSGLFPESPPPLLFFTACLAWFLGQVSHQTWNSLARTNWLTSTSSQPDSTYPTWGLQACTSMPDFLCRLESVTAGPHACMAGT